MNSLKADVQEAVGNAMTLFGSHEYFSAVATVRRALLESSRDLETLDK